MIELPPSYCSKDEDQNSIMVYHPRRLIQAPSLERRENWEVTSLWSILEQQKRMAEGDAGGGCLSNSQRWPGGQPFCLLRDQAFHFLRQSGAQKDIAKAEWSILRVGL